MLLGHVPYSRAKTIKLREAQKRKKMHYYKLNNYSKKEKNV